MRRPGRDAVVFFDGGAGGCPAALQAVHLVVSWSGHPDGIKRWLDGEGMSQAHLIGHGAGGNGALRFAMAHPERTRSLILSETGVAVRRSRASLRAVTAPVLVIAGGDGSACPLPTAREVAARFNSGRVVEIVEAARSPYRETPDEWCEVVLQFLRSVTRQKATTP